MQAPSARTNAAFVSCLCLLRFLVFVCTLQGSELQLARSDLASKDATIDALENEVRLGWCGAAGPLASDAHAVATSWREGWHANLTCCLAMQVEEAHTSNAALGKEVGCCAMQFAAVWVGCPRFLRTTSMHPAHCSQWKFA